MTTIAAPTTRVRIGRFVLAPMMTMLAWLIEWVVLRSANRQG